MAALLCASMLAPAFGAPQATSAASLAKKLASTLRIAKRAIKGLQVEGKRGPAGPPGATGAMGQPGAQGDKGDLATRLWAVINVSGTTGRGSGVTGSAKVATGQYEVVFNRDVTACSYQATMSISPGEAVAQPRASVPNGVFVGTYTSAGAAADRAFHLAVFC